jgi:hypothetical protein
MNKLEIALAYIDSAPLPDWVKVKCAPPELILKARVDQADLNLIHRMEEDAWTITYYNSEVGNDIYEAGIPRTPTFRTIHALEHLVILTWLQTGYLSPTELKRGNLALTVSSNDVNLNEIALVWARKGLSDIHTFTSSLQSVMKQYGARYYSG